VSSDTFKEPSQREDAKKTIKKLLEDRYTGGKNKWFFTALRVSWFTFVGSAQALMTDHFSSELLVSLCMSHIKFMYAS
jgi:hypothetical protein